MGDSDSPAFGGALPPSAVIAEGLARLISELDLFGEEILGAGGVVHTSQEAQFLAPVMPGDQLTVTAKIAGNTLRRGLRFLSVSSEIQNDSGTPVATASSTIMVPL